MNSFAWDRISSRVSARSFAAAITRPLISACMTAGFNVAQSMRGAVGGGGAGTQFGQYCGNGGRGGLAGFIVCQFDAANSISPNHENHSADQLRAGKRMTSLRMLSCPIA